MQNVLQSVTFHGVQMAFKHSIRRIFGKIPKFVTFYSTQYVVEPLKIIIQDIVVLYLTLLFLEGILYLTFLKGRCVWLKPKDDLENTDKTHKNAAWARLKPRGGRI